MSDSRYRADDGATLRRIVEVVQRLLVGLALLLAGMVVGAVPAAAQNGVGVSTPVMINTVGAAKDIGAGQRLGKTVPQPQIVVATGVAAEGASSGLSIGEKIAGQMGPRGWSKSLMQETIDNPAATHTVWDFTSGTREAATAYARADGSYVVVNDGIRAVVQVSDINKVGWKPVWDDPRFQR